jgi:putative peptidoglycan lipid II flippase
MVRLLFERGAFTAESTEHVAFALRCLAPALVFYSITGLLVRAFNARGDVKTPMKISLFCLCVNLALVLALLGRFPDELRQGAFGIANSLSAGLNCVLLAMALKRRGIELDLSVKRGPRASLQLATCTLLAAVAVGGGLLLAYNLWGTQDLGPRVGAVLLPMAMGALVHLGLGRLLGVPTVQQIWGILRGRHNTE